MRNTSIPVWELESFRRLGMKESRLLDDYATLTVSDLASAWVYAAVFPQAAGKDKPNNPDEEVLAFAVSEN